MIISSIDFKKESWDEDEAENGRKLEEYLLNFFKDILKSPPTEPI